MFSFTIVLLSTTLLGLTSATPLSARPKTCSPPASSNVSFATPDLTNQGGSLPAGSISVGPMQMGMLALTGQFLLAMWVPPGPSQIGTQWNLIKNGSEFLIEFVLFFYYPHVPHNSFFDAHSQEYPSPWKALDVHPKRWGRRTARRPP